MSEALGYIYEIYDNFINFVFNQMEIEAGVTIGWVAVAVFIFRILIKSLLNLPRSGRSIKVGDNDG